MKEKADDGASVEMLMKLKADNAGAADTSVSSLFLTSSPPNMMAWSFCRFLGRFIGLLIY